MFLRFINLKNNCGLKVDIKSNQKQSLTVLNDIEVDADINPDGSEINLRFNSKKTDVIVTDCQNDYWIPILYKFDTIHNGNLGSNDSGSYSLSKEVDLYINGNLATENYETDNTVLGMLLHNPYSGYYEIYHISKNSEITLISDESELENKKIFDLVLINTTNKKLEFTLTSKDIDSDDLTILDTNPYYFKSANDYNVVFEKNKTTFCLSSREIQKPKCNQNFIFIRGTLPFTTIEENTITWSIQVNGNSIAQNIADNSEDETAKPLLKALQEAADTYKTFVVNSISNTNGFNIEIINISNDSLFFDFIPSGKSSFDKNIYRVNSIEPLKDSKDDSTLIKNENIYYDSLTSQQFFCLTSSNQLCIDAKQSTAYIYDEYNEHKVLTYYVDDELIYTRGVNDSTRFGNVKIDVYADSSGTTTIFNRSLNNVRVKIVESFTDNTSYEKSVWFDTKLGEAPDAIYKHTENTNSVEFCLIPGDYDHNDY